jgi:putative salt-induced outer membrane protein YdiY
VLTRNAVAGGAAFKLINTARQALTADAGIGYLNESRVAGADISSATYLAGATYKLKLSDTADLTDDLRVLGVFDNTDDWRVVHTIALTARLTSVLSLKVSNLLRHANFPPPGFKKTDTTTAVALVLAVKRP